MILFYKYFAGWSTISTLSSYLFPKYKYLNGPALLNTLVSMYFIKLNTNDHVMMSTLAYYTNDLYYIIHTNYYKTYKERMIYFTHHVISIILICRNFNDKDTNISIAMTIMYDIEVSNVGLYVYYIVSKLTREPIILFITNTIETILYAYYRIGLVKYYNDIMIIEHDYFQMLIIFAMYIFGIFSSYALTICMYKKFKKIKILLFK